MTVLEFKNLTVGFKSEGKIAEAVKGVSFPNPLSSAAPSPTTARR